MGKTQFTGVMRRRKRSKFTMRDYDEADELAKQRVARYGKSTGDEDRRLWRWLYHMMSAGRLKVKVIDASDFDNLVWNQLFRLVALHAGYPRRHTLQENIAALYLAGYSDSEIAFELTADISTVRQYRRRAGFIKGRKTVSLL